MVEFRLAALLPVLLRWLDWVLAGVILRLMKFEDRWEVNYRSFLTTSNKPRKGLKQYKRLLFEQSLSTCRYSMWQKKTWVYVGSQGRVVRLHGLGAGGHDDSPSSCSYQYFTKYKFVNWILVMHFSVNGTSSGNIVCTNKAHLIKLCKTCNSR